MKKHLHILLAAAIAGLLAFSGCQTRTIIPEEVLQLPTHAKIYTACNLWYEKPNAMNADNVQKGTIIPFGTEVKIISMTNSKIVFQVKDKKFTIHYSEGRMVMPIEEFAKKIFGTAVAVEIAAGVKPATFEKMRRGIIETGMTRRHVIATYGYPGKIRTPNPMSDSWIYWIDKVKSKRVIFKDDKVVAEIVLE